MQLNVSPSAVNRQILKLEAEYGAALFERLPRGLSLTEAGRILVADIERWQHDHARTLQGLAELRSPMRGQAAIGLMESFGRAMVSRLMTHMAERHFQVSLDVFIGGTEQIVGQLVARKLDLAVSYAVPRQPDIQFLGRVPSNPGIVVARSHPLANRKSIRLADCARHSFVLPDASLHLAQAIWKGARDSVIIPRCELVDDQFHRGDEAPLVRERRPGSPARGGGEKKEKRKKKKKRESRERERERV